MKLENYVLNVILKDYIKIDEKGNSYITEDDLIKVKLTPQGRKFVEYVLKDNNIELRDQLVDKNERSPYVSDFQYGEQKAFETRKFEKTTKLEVEYIDDLEFVEKEDELEYFLENDFIPNNVIMKQKKDKETGEIILFPSIKLNTITALKLSEIEVEYVMNYLNKQNIRVCGYSESLDSEFENYDYYRTYKDAVLPVALTSDEINQKYELWKATNDPVIREQIILGNMRLVPYLSFFMAGYYGVDQKELEQYGYEALIEVVDRFDHTSGYCFSTYACPYIRGKLKSAVLEMLGVGRANFSFAYLRAKKVVEELNNIKLFENPEYIEDVVDILIGQNVISEGSREIYINRIQLLNTKSDNIFMEETDLISNIDIENTVTQGTLGDNIKTVLDTLEDRERKVLILRFGLDDGQCRTYEEVGQIFGVTRERIRQIEAKALRKLRHPSRSRKIKDYLDDNSNFYIDKTEYMLDEHTEISQINYDEDYNGRQI